ncbi:MAG: hypothetical protein CML13_06940 [Puniceicoccaceae bacterium]|nr:hypothetical protein [Puniceicoccaceae bacterium]|tara:strand:+ start:18214 stop:18780 length:567 start_codon:yes stop_codon:yes gene_type:complete
MMNSDLLLDAILANLQPKMLRDSIDLPLLETVERLASSEEEELSYAGFVRLIKRASQALLNTAGNVVHPCEALARGEVWLNLHYGKLHGSGYEMALLDYLENSSRSVELIIQALFLGAQQEMRQAWIDTQFAPLDWHQRITLISTCKMRFANTLPRELLDRPDWCLVDHLPDLIDICLDDILSVLSNR